MSLKSNKSSNEDFSEFFETSFSFRSVSAESLNSESSEEDTLARELMFHLTPVVLTKLRRRFRKTRPQDPAKDIDRRIEEVMRLAAAEEGLEFSVSERQDSLWMDRSSFVNALMDIFGHNKYKPHADALFTHLDPFRSGRVRWGQLVNELVRVGARQTRGVGGREAGGGRVVKLDHCKRETIVKIVHICKARSFCFCIVSRGGRVGLYSGGLQLLQQYQVFYHRTGTQRRVKNCWITDAVYLNDVEYLVFSASDRSLTIYDAATLIHTPVYCITGLKYIPICMSYYSCSSSSRLALGVECGDVIILSFLQPTISLFSDKSHETIHYYFWQDITSLAHANFVSITTYRNVHNRAIRRVALFKDVLVTSSKDSDVAVRVKYLDGRLPDYVYKIPGGATSSHALANGSVVICTSPTAGVYQCYAGRAGRVSAGGGELRAGEGGELYTIHKDCYLHIWDMNEESLLQKIKIKFPFLGVLGKKVEFGPYSLFQGPPRSSCPPPEAPALGSSRRSSVVAAESGGLLLENVEACSDNDVEQPRYKHPELLITANDHVYILNLEKDPSESGELLPPPGDTLRARRPSYWDLPDDIFTAYPSQASSCTEDPVTSSSSVNVNVNQFLSPSTAEIPTYDLDSLLENAGLQDIIKKDFVLMHGLQHDLNKKLAELNADRDVMRTAVSMEAPYLAVRLTEPRPLAPVDELMDRYREVMKLFPPPSAMNTPTGSNTSTLSKRNSSKSSRSRHST